jgi:ribulose-5-phosphate 4-epimerase/fuculose-1-phosphate aldolase
MSGACADERVLRVQLAACYRIFALLGWDELIYNHVTVRVPGPDRHFLINPFGLRIDAAHCVMHTHTTAGSAVASSEAGLSFDNFYSAMLHERIAYHDFEGITVHADEGPRVLRSIGDRPAVILRNHGLLSWGPTIPFAFAVLWTLQRACEIQVAGAALGATRAVPEAVRRRASADALQFDPRYGGGQDGFDALVRRLDRIDPSYRD